MKRRRSLGGKKKKKKKCILKSLNLSRGGPDGMIVVVDPPSGPETKNGGERGGRGGSEQISEKRGEKGTVCKRIRTGRKKPLQTRNRFSKSRTV